MNTPMQGCYGRLLSIDLTSRTAQTLPIEDKVLRATLGGKGLASRLLLELNPPGADPLGPDNRLIVATGPAAGSLVWGGSRFGVYTKSPQTGGYLESYSGGRTPEAVDAAGYDAVVLRGRSEKPVLLMVHPEGCEFVDASDLWGLETYEAEEKALEAVRHLYPQYAKAGAMVIGPAGERLIPFAIIANDRWRCAGRGGAGAVLGAKLVKGIAFTGDRKRALADPKGLVAMAKQFAMTNRDNPGVKAYQARGTTQMVALMNTVKAFPAKYWSQSSCEHWESIGGDRFHQDHEVTAHACAKCFMACGRLTRVCSGRHAGLRLEGPEYETIYAFGGLCMIEDMAEIVHLNDLCDRLGMDTITAGNLCGLGIEAARRGKADCAVDYNDPDGVAGLLQGMATGEGLGGVLAKGMARASAELDMEDVAVHVKNMEPPGYDPRVLKGMGLSYAVSPRGACHLRATFYKPELAGMIDPQIVEGKAELFVDFEDRLTLFDTLILCRFYRDLYDWEKLGGVIRLLTGLDMDKGELRALAASVVDSTRRFNLREGLGRDSDRLPRRLLEETLPSGHSLSREDMEYMLADYYRVRGWDEQGRPGNEE